MSGTFPLPEAQLKQLQLFVELLKNPAIGPQLLHAPQMQFFRDYLVSLGATLPPKAPAPSHATESKEDADREEADAAVDDDYDEDDEADVNAFPRDVVDESQQPFGDSSVEVTDDTLTQSDQLKNQAREAAGEGDYVRAVSLYSQAIVCNPGSASLIAKRAEAFLKLSKPMAAIHDCNKAIQLNKNAAGAYYVRGKARALIGEWESALHDMQVADQLDADCGAYDLLKDYREKGDAAKSKRVEKERKRAEKEKKKEKKKHSSTKPVHLEEEEEEDEGGFNFGGAGAGAGAGGMPDLMGMLGNPKIQKMMQEVMSNPAKLNEYMNDPEVGPLLKQAMASFGGEAGGNPFASFGGGAAPSSSSSASPGGKSSFNNDVDVD